MRDEQNGNEDDNAGSRTYDLTVVADCVATT